VNSSLFRSTSIGTSTDPNPPSFSSTPTPKHPRPHPNPTPQDIGSGDSYVHNTLLFDHPEKSVCYAPWSYSPQPLWSVFQGGLEGAIPPALKYITNQDRPVVALYYLIQVALAALVGTQPMPRAGKA
jgi:hypothetical protein